MGVVPNHGVLEESMLRNATLKKKKKKKVL